MRLLWLGGWIGCGTPTGVSEAPTAEEAVLAPPSPVVPKLSTPCMLRVPVRGGKRPVAVLRTVSASGDTSYEILEVTEGQVRSGRLSAESLYELSLSEEGMVPVSTGLVSCREMSSLQLALLPAERETRVLVRSEEQPVSTAFVSVVVEEGGEITHVVDQAVGRSGEVSVGSSSPEALKLVVSAPGFTSSSLRLKPEQDEVIANLDMLHPVLGEVLKEGKPVVGVRVLLSARRQPFAEAVTNGEGKFKVAGAGIPAETVSVFGADGWACERAASPVLIALSENRTIQGRVLQGGEVMANQEVSWRHRCGLTGSTVTNSRGQYTLMAPSDVITVVVGGYRETLLAEITMADLRL